MAVTNLVSDVTAPVNYLLMEGLLEAARKRLPMFNGTKAGALRTNTGAPAVEWERIENLTAKTTALSEPVTTSAWQNGRTPSQPSVTRVTATPSKYGDFIELTEEVDLIQMNARAMAFMDTLGAQAGESLNELAIDTYQTVTTTSIRFGSGAASAGAINDAVTSNDIKYVVNQLNRQSAMKFTSIGTGSQNVGTSPIRDAYYGICHVDVEEDIRGNSNFIAVEQYAGYMPVEPCEIGMLNGVRWCSTELAGLLAAGIGSATSVAGVRTTSSSADVYDSFIYGRNAVGTVGLGKEHAKSIYMMGEKAPTVELIQHGKGSAGAGDPFNEKITLAWKAWYAGAILNHNWVWRLRTAASALS